MFNWFWEFLYGLIKVPLFCIDIIMMIARKLCGIDPIQVEETVNGETVVRDVDLLSYFMEGETILGAFGYVCLFGFILLFLFTAFRILRDQLSFYEKKSPVRTCLDAAKTLLFFLLVPAIMIVGTTFVATLLRGVYEATANGNSGLGGAMFVIFADEAYIGPDGDKQAVLEAFRTCSLEEYLAGTNEYSYYNTSLVSQYFSLSKFNIFLGLVGSISVLILLSLTLLSFVERIISLVLLFVIAPLPMSASPLDDGERFKIWREQTINKFLIAYGGLLALNIFSLMLPMIASISFFRMGGTGGNLVNGIARLLFIIGGAFACRRGMVLIGNLISRGAGSQDLMDQSHLSGGMASLAHLAGRVVKGTFGAVTGAASKGIQTGLSWANAAGVPTSVADYIKQRREELLSMNHAPSERAARAAEENRYNGFPDRGRDQGADAIKAALQGSSGQAGNAPSGGTAAPQSASFANSPAANHEKNGELNQSAQNDIKNALQNQKSAQSNDDSKNKA